MFFEEGNLRANIITAVSFLLAIVAFITAWIKGNVSMPLILYIILGAVIILVNAFTFLPLFTGYFIILKLMGKIALSWSWIAATVILDIIFELMVAENRM